MRAVCPARHVFDEDHRSGLHQRVLKDNPPPQLLTHQWAGLTYINTVWQNKMVFGMLQSFLGSFLAELAIPNEILDSRMIQVSGNDVLVVKARQPFSRPG